MPGSAGTVEREGPVGPRRRRRERLRRRAALRLAPRLFARGLPGDGRDRDARGRSVAPVRDEQAAPDLAGVGGERGGRTEGRTRDGRDGRTENGFTGGPPRLIDIGGAGRPPSSNPAASPRRRRTRSARASWSDARESRKVTHLTSPFREAWQAEGEMTPLTRVYAPPGRPRAAHVGRAARLRARRKALGECAGRRHRATRSEWRFCGRGERRAGRGRERTERKRKNREEEDFLEGAGRAARRRPPRRGAAPTFLSHSKKTSGGRTRRISFAATFPARST